MEEKSKSDINSEVTEVQLPEKRSKWFFIYYILYIIMGFVGYYLFKTNNGSEIVLGDFGEITNVVFFVLAMTSAKWLPILSIVGIILYFNRNKLKDIVFIYMVSVVIIFTVSTFILIR